MWIVRGKSQRELQDFHSEQLKERSCQLLAQGRLWAKQVWMGDQELCLGHMNFEILSDPQAEEPTRLSLCAMSWRQTSRLENQKMWSLWEGTMLPYLEGQGQVLPHHCLALPWQSKSWAHDNVGFRAHIQPPVGNCYNDCSAKMRNIWMWNQGWLWQAEDSSCSQLNSHRLWSREWKTTFIVKPLIHTAKVKVYCKITLHLTLWTDNGNEVYQCFIYM